MSAYACLVVPYFAAAALERAEPALRERPLAVIAGISPLARVLDANDAARACGVCAPMTEADARARCPRLALRALPDDVATAARHALLDAALAISPRVEDAAPGLVHVDTSGLERLIGDASAVGRRLVREARRVGLTATVGLAESRAAARVAARLGPSVTVVAPGRERAMLAHASIALLEPDAATAVTLERWGVRTLGQLADLPRAGVSARLGAEGLRLHDLACGHDREPFRAWTPPPFYQEARGLEWEIATLDALRPVLLAILERLAARLHAGHLAADTLDADLTLASGEHHHRRLPLAHPMSDAKAMLALALMDIEAHPPGAGITAVAVTANTVRALPGQSGLWDPRLPASRDLATVLTRLTALVGAPSVGTPVVIDSHHPDAITLTRFEASDAGEADTTAEHRGTAGRSGRAVRGVPGSRADYAEKRNAVPLFEDHSEGPRHAPHRPPASAGAHGVARPALMLRRLRPPRAITVEADGAPRVVTWSGRRYAVTASAGPWRTSGAWWDAGAWARDEWDVALADGTLCRVACDARTGAWVLDGVYD